MLTWIRFQYSLIAKLPEKNNKNWNLAGGQSSATVLHPKFEKFFWSMQIIRNKTTSSKSLDFKKLQNSQLRQQGEGE
jgi:hypothetical protein